MSRDLAAWCEELVTEGLVSAVAVEKVEPRGQGNLRGRAGTMWSGGPPVDERALFDLASLTKPWSATLALWLAAKGELALGTCLGELWPHADAAIAAIRLEDLLRHRAGFFRWRPLYALCRSAEEVEERLLSGEWRRAGGIPDGEEGYSDLDYLLWGLAAERATGTSYEDLMERMLADLAIPGIAATGRPAATKHGVECRLSTRREVELAAAEGLRVGEQPPPSRGTVQDGNCRFFGRAMAHAGLFGSVGAMTGLARLWLSPDGPLSAAAVELALRSEGRFTLGWFRSDETAAGRLAGASARGHDGFTGGTIWLDPERGSGLVMLAHRTSLRVDLTTVRAELVRRVRAL